MIADAARGGEPVAAEAMERLVRRYWPAVYAFIRRSGRDVHEAADLTQGLVCDVLISGRLCDVADPERGRFRALLLCAVQNYLRQRHRQEKRRRRSGNRRSAKPDDGPAFTETPEDAFCYQWSATLVRRVLAAVRSNCQSDGLGPHWTVFEERVARPMLLGEQPTEYALLVERLRLKDESQAANMMITVKRRFVRALLEEVGMTLSRPQDADEELRELLRDLERAK